MKLSTRGASSISVFYFPRLLKSRNARDQRMARQRRMGTEARICDPVDGMPWTPGGSHRSFARPCDDTSTLPGTAAEVATRLDDFGPVRGSSLCGPVDQAPGPPEPAVGSLGSRLLSIPSFRRPLPPVPLLDFNRLTVFEERVLGAGSSARVYEGRWCGRKCAGAAQRVARVAMVAGDGGCARRRPSVKMLFLLDVTPKHVERACQEVADKSPPTPHAGMHTRVLPRRQLC
jgi:hypothetical protein